MENIIPSRLLRKSGSLCVNLSKLCPKLGWKEQEPLLIGIESGRIVIARAVPEPQPAAPKQAEEEGGQA